jgi:hypothetical protein
MPSALVVAVVTAVPPMLDDDHEHDPEGPSTFAVLHEEGTGTTRSDALSRLIAPCWCGRD